jgi:nitric oxide reductase subunit B
MRSAEIIYSPVMQAVVWAGVPGDLVFTVGVVAFSLFMGCALFGGPGPATSFRRLD